MGRLFLDQYSFLHFCVGGVLYFWGMTLLQWVGLHTLFEIVENTPWGMYVINNYLRMWPGGKPKPDTPLNVVGDTVAAAAGFLAAQQIDRAGSRRGWYTLHINT